MSGPSFKPRMPLSEPRMEFDQPHEPWGSHIDLITPLGSGIKGVEKIRFGTEGEFLSHEFRVGKKSIDLLK